MAMYIARFDTEEEMNEYNLNMSNIRNLLGDLNERHKDGKKPRKYMQQLRKQWVPLVQEMTTKYGLDMIPVDIRWSINDVYKNIDKEKIEWPTIILLPPE